MSAHSSLVLPILALGVASPAPRRGDDPLPEPRPEVTRAELEHHVRFLASDELEGRAQASQGQDRAAAYLARALEAAGLEPAGEDGGWFQETAVRRVAYPSVPRLLFQDEAGGIVEAVYGRDFGVNVRGSATSTEMLPLRFFYDYNHFRMPRTGNPDEAIHFSAGAKARKQIFERLRIEDLEDWGLEVNVNLGPNGLEEGTPETQMPERLVESLEGGAEEVVLRGPLRRDFERRAFTHVQLLIEEDLLPYRDRNVVARLPGAGTPEHPELADEVVLVSATYDHVGIRPPHPRARPRDDWIFNGANDDASGVAALLELAQALGSGPRPARTLVFLLATGGEGADEGVARYVASPAAPLERTVAHLNLDALGLPDPDAGGAGHAWLGGFERSNIGQAWLDAGLPLVPDPQPREGRFQQCKLLELALAGVVTDMVSSRPVGAHRPRWDDHADGLDYTHLEQVTRAVLAGLGPLADGSLRPEWRRGGQPRTLADVDLPEARSEEQKAAERAARREARRARQAEEDDGEEDDGEDDDGEDG